MAQLADILIGSPLPLHPRFGKNPWISLQLLQGEKILKETRAVAGDENYIWEINSPISLPDIDQSLTLVVMVHSLDSKRRLVSATFRLADLYARLKASPNDYYEFVTCDSCAVLQVILSCCVKATPTIVEPLPHHAVDDTTSHLADEGIDETERKAVLEGSSTYSREDLRRTYTKFAYLPNSDEKTTGLGEVGRAYYGLYLRDRDSNDLDNAISIQRESVNLGYFHPQLALYLKHLSSALEKRYDYSGNRVDIDEAIEASQNALSLMQRDAPERPNHLMQLAINHDRRFERLGDVADIDVAISTFSECLALMPAESPDKPWGHNNLANSLLRRFERLGVLEDLNRAIDNLENAVTMAPDGHPYKPSAYTNLGHALNSRFKRQGDLIDLNNAVSNLEHAVSLTSDGHPGKSSLYENLGSGHLSRFGRLGDLVDLNNAISNQEKALTLIPDGHPDRPSLYCNLGTALQYRFECLGDLADLEMAICNLENAVSIMSDGHPDNMTLYNNLGTALQHRSERLGDHTDLEMAISNLENALNLTPDGHPDKPSRYINLARSLRYRCGRLGDITDLNNAISNLEKALSLTPDGHQNQPSCYDSLGNALGHRFYRIGDLADLEMAIFNLETALNLTPDGHPGRPLRYNNLGIALESRFRRLGDLLDLNKAISHQENAMGLMLDGRPEKVKMTFNLARSYELRFNSLSNISDLNLAHSLYVTAAQSPVGYPQQRFWAAIGWSNCSKLMSISPLPAFGYAIDQLPRIAWLGISAADQHSLLEEIGWALREAVAAAIDREEYEMAVEWMEQGRSIVWQNLVKLRTPVDALRAKHPKLADQLQSISRQLSTPASSEPKPKTGQYKQPEQAAKSHTSLAMEWDQTVDEVRKLPNFESFLKPKRFDSLAPVAREGPIVILNAAKDRCDVLALVSDGNSTTSIVPIPLENFSLDTGRELFMELTRLLALSGVRNGDMRASRRVSSKADPNAIFKSILRKLWQDVVKPVIDGLAYQPCVGDLPRIWWCATGPLAFLPIHAAGDYDATEVGHKVSDYVVSSYAPTLTATLDSSYPNPSKDFKLLTVAQPSAPGMSEIPKTMDEVEKIATIATGVPVVSLAKEEATVERVQKGMRESNWVHLACHGKQDAAKSFDSGLVLHDGTLKLSTIVQEILPNAEFAFLSACQTAMGNHEVAEESAHLAAGMLLAGYKGVIATAWSIRDEIAPQVTEVVYSRMLMDGKPNRREAAYALHEAVKRLRESGADFTSWVPFIHIGR